MKKSTVGTIIMISITILSLISALLLIIFGNSNSFPGGEDNDKINTEIAKLNLVESKDEVTEFIEGKEKLSTELFKNGCDAGTGIKYITLASPENRFYTNNSKTTPTKTISITGDLGTVYLCIIPDISNKKESYNDYRKHQSYNAVTYIKVGGYEGYYDVGITKDHNNFYDSDSNNKIPVKKELNGKYWTHELPLVQLIDTSKNITVADIETEGTKEIYLGSEFKDGKTINIGAFMTALGENDYWASSIKEFKILWDGEGSIKIE